ncbi:MULTISPECIES: hypothetical protein [unclassified Clostridium]|mgnify:FL=1|uniref:hypothetical protein n=1 Tax=Clostridium TaxID=1485 RepID=UPI001C8BA2FF|nr:MULTISPECIES: hypothetical protein [unclassified Clostridium]MBX9139367.1 hypothetical protein [Clostridium sp. K12(2020)]MBX9146107.1 hypothetical protein [Clostridium sp. K13]MDU2292238.1 hypothetical protein [Clostridium celatum]
MIDKYTSLCDAIAENPVAANILMSYGIPTYDITENQFSSLEEISKRYNIDINSVINQINSGLASLY